MKLNSKIEYKCYNGVLVVPENLFNVVKIIKNLC